MLYNFIIDCFGESLKQFDRFEVLLYANKSIRTRYTYKVRVTSMPLFIHTVYIYMYNVYYTCIRMYAFATRYYNNKHFRRERVFCTEAKYFIRNLFVKSLYLKHS